MSVPALVAPPIRVCLEDAFTRAAGGRDDPPPATEKQWYLFWSGLAGRLNGLVGYGRSDERPDPGSVPDGALYGQIDPGYVIYQSIEGEWHYVAGTMYATLNPDQRPTGLGPNDAGFDFRAVDTDPQYSGREFIWSGSVWVEATQARFGTHAARLALTPAGIVNGMLWSETDRSEVIYQNQGGTWHYLAGTMYGTMSPDQRPTGLGVNDAGFQFRSTDLPARFFIWSGTAWTEATPFADPTTTKGDLIGRGTAAPATRFGVGANGQVLTADSTQTLGIKWASPATLTTQTSPARSLGVVYQNTSGKPIYVTASVVVFVSGGNGRADAFVDASTSPSTLVASAFKSITGGTQLSIPLTFVVLPTYYYKVQVTSGGVVLAGWVEWN